MPTPVVNRPGSNGSAPSQILPNDGVAWQNTNQALTLAKSWSFPAGCLGESGQLEIDAMLTWSLTASGKEYAFRLVGVGGSFEFTQGTPNSVASTRVKASFRNQANQASQISMPPSGDGLGNNGTAMKRGTIDTSQPFTVDLYLAAFVSPDFARFEHATFTVK